jgi:hypothetical protein
MASAEIPLSELEGRLADAMRGSPSVRRVALCDRAFGSLEQLATLVPDPVDGYCGAVLVYDGQTSADAQDRGINWVVVAHRWRAPVFLTRNQKLPSNDEDSENLIKAMADDMRLALVSVRSLGYGMSRVKHGLYQVATSITKQPSQTIGDFHVVPGAITVNHWYYRKQC